MTSASCFVMFLCTNKGFLFSLSGALGAITGYAIVLSISYFQTRKSDKVKKFVTLKQQIKYFIIFVLIMVSGLVIDDRIYFFIVGFIGTVFFGMCTCYIIYKFFSKSPSFQITSKGIYDNSTMTGIGQINWNEIKDVFTYVEMNNKMLAIVPHNIEVIINRQSMIKKIFIRKQKFISIPQNTLSISIEELEEEIKSRITLNNN